MQIEKNKIEESKKLVEQDLVRLMNEKEASDCKITELLQDIETTKRSYENQCQQVEAKATLATVELQENIKELEFLLAESRKSSRELEELSESKIQTLREKQYIFRNVIDSQLQTVQVCHVCTVAVSVLLYLKTHELKYLITGAESIFGVHKE